MSEDTFASRLRWWLQRANLITDPFALSEADQERKYLPGLFVDRPYLYDILGDVERLQPSFLLARRGEGKTATREMIAYECETLTLKDRVLAIRYYDFSHVLEIADNDPSKITAKHHARAIVRTCMKVLVDNVPAPYFEQIKDEDRKLFAAYIQQFADPISAVPLLKLLNSEPLDVPLLSLSALEIFASLVKLLTQLGPSKENHYEAIYILVDRVDESDLGPDAAISILRPLVSQRPLLEAPGIAFKFFLPLEIGELLQRTVELRNDRMCIRQIEWDSDALRKLINQRINYYSEGQKTTFEELCTYTIRQKALKKLIDVCKNSPRKLIQMCDRMIYLHVNRSRETLFESADLLDTIGEVIQQREIESTRPPISDENSLIQTIEGIREKGLYLNDGGQVWIDGNPVDPPLTDLEFELLRTLYRKSPNIVSTLNMVEAIWPGGGGDEQNLRKLIGRLRKRLEPISPGTKSRFIRNSKGRGYWLNLDISGY